MTVRILTRPEELAAALETVSHPSYLQSWAWGEFQEKYGRRVWRLGAYDRDRPIGAMTVIQHALVLGRTYLYVPHGPVTNNPDALKDLLVAARQLGRDTRAMFMKIDPPMLDPAMTALMAELDAATALQPRHTLLVDLDAEPDALLTRMHQKTRYNIRLAERRGVMIRWSTSPEDFQAFMKLQMATFTRQGIRLHPIHYYEAMFNCLVAAGMIELAIAEYQGQVLAINQLVTFGGITYFIHGGSADTHKEVMAPYLLQWHSILRAKQQGSVAYDFRGIAPPDRPDHKLAGVTRFKLGFGGRRAVFPEARNVIFDRRWWMIYRMAKRLRGGRDE